MKTDIEIAQSCKPESMEAIAAKAGIPDEYWTPYGRSMAKVDYHYVEKSSGHLVLSFCFYQMSLLAITIQL